MKKNHLGIELFIYAAIFIFAACIRLFHLGNSPLSDSESRLALEALNISRGHTQASVIGPGYAAITSILFFLMGSSNFLARFFPAMAGSLLSVSPYLFRNHIGKGPAIILAIVFAIDPGMVAISRQLDNGIIAITSLVFAIGYFLKKNPNGLGIAAGFALLSGAKLWVGFIPLCFAFGIHYLIYKTFPGNIDIPNQNLLVKDERKRYWLEAGFWLVSVIILIGTLLFLKPGGIGAIAESYKTLFSRIGTVPEVSIFQFLLTIIVYGPIPLILGLIAIIKSLIKKEYFNIFLAIWWIISLVFVLIYPMHEIIDVTWSFIPLWLLAIREGFRLFNINEIEDPGLLLGIIFLTIILIVFIIMNLVGLLNPSPGNVEVQLRWAGIGSGVILLLLLGFLFGWAWSKELAFKGIGFGLFVILVLYTFSTGLRAGGLSSNPETEIWRTTPFFQEADLLQKTVKDVSEWNKGDKDLLEVTLEGIDSPSLEWLFRDTQNLRKIEKISYDTTSAIIITPDKTDISLSNAYRGQDFIWHQTPNWSLLSFSEWATWLVFRKTPLENENIILWVRADLFPGNQSTVSGILK